MKFKGEPNLLVRFSNKNLRKGNRQGFRFDSNGLYETENKKVIQALKRKFEVVSDVEEVQEPVEEIIFTEELEETKKLKHCKHCDFSCENQGDLLAHYRMKHPKKV